MVIKEVIVNYYWSQIQNSLATRGLLLAGSSLIGKRAVAHHIAKYLLCERRVEGDFVGQGCGECISCRNIVNGCATNLQVLQDEGKILSIKEIRVMQERVFLADRAKIILIENLNRADTAAWNSLLKIIEEPPQNTTFIITSSEVDTLPETIISRLQVVELKPPDDQEAVALLMQLFPTEEEVNIKKFYDMSAGRIDLARLFITDLGASATISNFYVLMKKFLTENKMSRGIALLGALKHKRVGGAKGGSIEADENTQRQILLTENPYDYILSYFNYYFAQDLDERGVEILERCITARKMLLAHTNPAAVMFDLILFIHEKRL